MNGTNSASTAAGVIISPSTSRPKLAEDLLRGADEIAAFLFGDPRLRRRVYHLKRLPTFKLGAVLCARKSVLLAYIEDQEVRRLKGSR